MSANTQQVLTEASEVDPANVVMVFQTNDGQLGIKFNAEMPLHLLMIMQRLLDKHIDGMVFTPKPQSPILRATP